MNSALLVRKLVKMRLFAAFVFAAAVGSPIAQEGDHFVSDPDSDKYAVILVGAAVNEERASQFGSWALDLRRSLQEDYGYPAGHLSLLVGSASEDDFNVDGPCRADTIRSIFEGLAKRIKPGDQLSVFLIGHGTGRGAEAKFNVVGPDLTGEQFAQLLDRIQTQNLIVVNTTSASADFSKSLVANGRVVVSATRSAAEKYDTVFPRYLVEGIQGQTADRDKNGRVSILEAFQFAKARVDGYYRERGTLASEHATLDDNGDGVFSLDPDRRGDGRLAEIAYLDVSRGPSVNVPPAVAELSSRMSNLERDIFLLRANKSTLGESEYWRQLEPLLVELAKVTREFDELPSR
jgi:hypothetical protein